MIKTPATMALYARIRPLCGFGPEGDEVAEAIMSLFTVCEQRNHDIDITSLGATRRQLLRQQWIVAALADGPVEHVEGEPLGLLDSFGQPT